MNQLEVHKKIDQFFKAEVDAANVRVAEKLVQYNSDAKRYFFHKADERWLKWLWENGLLDELEKPAHDPSRYSYQLPELEYLTRMSDKDAETVCNVIQDTPIGTENFNPEVIDRFLWIIGLLPLEEIKILLPKVDQEGWLELMVDFNQSGYSYHKVVETIRESEDEEALFMLAKIILKVRTKEKLKIKEGAYTRNKFFYLDDISRTDIFDSIIKVKDESIKIFLELLLSILEEVVKLGNQEEDSVYDFSEPFYLMEVDIFKVKLDNQERLHSKEDIQNVVAASKELIKRLFNECEGSNARELYQQYIEHLSDSVTTWKLKLYAITRCPELFVEEIKSALFRVFEVDERYFDVTGGAEYDHTLDIGFSFLPKETQIEYVDKVLTYFGQSLQDKKREEWRKVEGHKLLSYIAGNLQELDLNARSLSVFGVRIDQEKPTPRPMVSRMRGGMVSHKSPVNLADFPVAAIPDHLKNDLSPEVLKEKFENDDFLSPRGVEGLSDSLKQDLKARLPDYLDNLGSFFDRELIHANYVYSLLRGVEEYLRDQNTLEDDQYIILINFFDVIRMSANEKEFVRNDEKSFLGDWITVHKVISDVLLQVLDDIKDSKTFKDNRLKILAILRYLFTIKYSPDTTEEKPEHGELFGIAINSVRGRAYQAFVQFMYNDGANLATEVKEIYESILDEDNSSAVRFLVGHYLGSFYFRDIDFIRSLLPKIFPKDNSALYFASWEGYLSSSLYLELFNELKEYYEYAVSIEPSVYPERKSTKGLDETLATHLALAFAHFDFSYHDSLFDSFWNTPNKTRHHEFISFLGRNNLIRAEAGDKWLDDNKVNKQKIINFWTWALTTDTIIEPEAFAGFGTWINPNLEVIEDRVVIANLPPTLEKSKGHLDWDYGFLRRLVRFAEINPNLAFAAIRNFLLPDGELNVNHRSTFYVEEEIKKSLKIVYQDAHLKEEVESLIDALIEKGSSIYWGLKEVLE